MSNHGGRQLDRAPDSLTSLAEVRAEVGPEMELIFDSGIMSGTDVVAALCAGADFVLIGRAYLYGLMAGGQRGVERAIALIQQEILTAMGLMGARSIPISVPTSFEDCLRHRPQTGTCRPTPCEPRSDLQQACEQSELMDRDLLGIDGCIVVLHQRESPFIEGAQQ